MRKEVMACLLCAAPCSLWPEKQQGGRPVPPVRCWALPPQMLCEPCCGSPQGLELTCLPCSPLGSLCIPQKEEDQYLEMRVCRSSGRGM
jgi:hypothetical protein